MKVLGKVIKSASDRRTYKAIQLENKLQCLLVSDQQAQKSSAALSVGIGSLLDPIEAQGLAHYLQHMLFMGTQKYPEQNDYMNYIAKNSGSSNAYTSQEQTNFHFQVASSAFVNTLDRFAQFFICPLMLESSSQRQLNAVHSQHSKNLQNDTWRKYQISKYLAKAGHPYSKFSTGDKSSLSNPNLRKMLFDFYNSNYSSNLMKMVVYGKQNVDQLGQIVQKQFSSIQNKNYKPYQMTQPPFDNKLFKKIVKITPVKDKRTLELTWILKDKSMHYRNAPSRYVAHILGHEGKGSLLSYLIAEGLANSLSAGGNDSYDCYSQFEVHVSLTDKGFQNIDRVIGHILYAVQTLQRQEPQKWVFQQIRNINKMKFDFMQKRQGMSFVSGLAKRLHKKSMQQVLYYPYLMEEWTPQLIKSYLNEMVSQNLIVMCQNKKYQAQCDQVEPIYKTKFTVKELSNIQAIPCDFHLPQKNTFIPQDLTILPLATNQYPVLLKDCQTNFIQPYYKRDHRFNLPKSEINLRFYFDGQSTVKEDVCRKLYEQMLKQSLRQFAYMAETAQLNSEVSFSNFYTMNIKVNGFRDSFTNFMSEYVSKILAFVPNDQKLFQTLKEKQIKNYFNTLLGNPYQLAYDSLFSALKQGSANPTLKKLQITPSITFNDIKQYSNYWRQRLYSEVLISGNMDENMAVNITRDIQQTMKKYSQSLRKEDISSVRPVFLPSDKICIVEQTLQSKQQTNCSIIVHYQYEAFKVRTKVLQDLAQAFVKEPAFDYLRTKEQLGYIVMSLPDDNRGILGMSILVQSNIKNSYELTQYVDTFIQKILRQNIDKLTEEEFNVYKSSLLSSKSQKDKNLGDESNRFWAQIVKHSYLFTRKEEELQILPTITLEEFKNFLNNLFYQNPRRFQIHEVPQTLLGANQQSKKVRVEQNQNIKIYPDIIAFRKKMQLYPDYYSHL